MRKFATNAGTVSTPPPVVTGTNVPSAVPGSRIKITGHQFGSQQSGCSVIIGGVKVSTVLSWTDQAIRCVVPEGAASGPVVVHTDAWGSNGVRIRIE